MERVSKLNPLCSEFSAHSVDYNTRECGVRIFPLVCNYNTPPLLGATCAQLVMYTQLCNCETLFT
jgi:hypothetical protein